MHLVSCLNPKLIYNAYLHEHVFVRCGKCDVCRNTYTLQWQKRLEREMQYNKYCIFFTLTYNDNNLPFAYWLTPELGISRILTRIYHVGRYNALRVVRENDKLSIKVRDFDDDTKAYLNSVDKVPYLRKKDVQDFVKRFRSNLHVLRKSKYLEDEKIRYFIAGEYGPVNYRPHYHGVLFFSSEFTRAHIKELLHKSWQNGYINWSDAQRKAGGYVAKYITGAADLPKVYDTPNFRPFFLCSKSKPIGLYQYSKEKEREIIKCGVTSEAVFDSSKSTIVDVPFLRSYESRLFPKVTAFSRLCITDKYTLYGVGKRFFEQSKEGTFEEFCLWINSIFPLRNFYYDRDNSLFQGLNLNTLDEELYTNLQRIMVACEYFVKSVDGSYSRLKNLFYQLKRFEINRYLYGFGVNEYVDYIDRYYSNKKYEQLVNQMRYEVDYSVTHKGDVSMLINLDPVYLDRALRTNYWQSDESILITLQGFGLNHAAFNTESNLVDVDVAELLDYRKSDDYKNMKAVHTKIKYDSLKNKKKNDAVMHRKKQMIYGKFI